MINIHVVLPNQLFKEVSAIKKDSVVYLIEESLFFTQFKFHKQKLVLHRASMKKYEAFLNDKGFETKYIDSPNKCSDMRQFIQSLSGSERTTLSLYDPSDDWIERRIETAIKKSGMSLIYLDSPMWLNSREQLSHFFDPIKKKFFQTQFYKSERKRLGLLLVNGDQPEGGKWTYDSENRKKYPKGKVPPAYPKVATDVFYVEAEQYIEQNFSDNPGLISKDPLYPTDYTSTERFFQIFLKERFAEFGPFEDALVISHSTLNHSVLTPMLNVGLITPGEIIEKTIKYAHNNPIPINSLEGFIRQIVGWREFIRGIYIAKGREERTTNFWNFKRKIPASFYNGTTGIEPIDITIKKVTDTGYNHHIERLMVLGNFMLLCEFDPDEVYKWFMEMYVDAYDWVMVPNVYGMSQFADGGLMSTKPYFSGSNYLMKMSDFKKGDWQHTWDGLFWRFISVHRDFFLQNPRLGMMVRLWDKMDESKKSKHLVSANVFLDKL